MFDVLIREVAVRFNLGDKALPLLQMLLACMTRQDTGGLPGFLEKLKAAGLGPAVQSWLGGGPSAKAVTASQIENALGSAGGLLEQLTGRLDAPRDDVAGALGYLLPYIVGKLTPGGSLPGSLPAEIASVASAGQALLSAPLPSSGGGMKWLWPAVAVVAAGLLGLSYCRQGGDGVPAPASAPVAAPQPAPASPVQPVETAPAPQKTQPETPVETPAQTPVREMPAQEPGREEKPAAPPMPEMPAAAAEKPPAETPPAAETVEPPTEEKPAVEKQPAA